MTTGSDDFPAAPLDRPTKLVTAAVIAALVGLGLTIPASEVGGLGVALVWLLPLGLMLLAYGFAPAGYQVSPDELHVQRKWFGSRRFQIRSAQTTSAFFGLGGLRLVGSGGVFGWYGLFWRKDTGRYRAYVTDRSRLVTCDGPDGIVVVSPVDPVAFVAAAHR